MLPVLQLSLEYHPTNPPKPIDIMVSIDNNPVGVLELKEFDRVIRELNKAREVYEMTRLGVQRKSLSGFDPYIL